MLPLEGLDRRVFRVPFAKCLIGFGAQVIENIRMLELNVGCYETHVSHRTDFGGTILAQNLGSCEARMGRLGRLEQSNRSLQMNGKTHMTNTSRKVLAVASGGGHWEQLMLLRDTLGNYDVRFATTDPLIAKQRGIADAETLPDCNQNTPLKAIHCAVVAIKIILKHRPDIVLSTGAAPGYFCLLAGRMVGARTLWIDSVANGEQLSMCGKLSKRTAHECLTQWEHLADGDTVKYRGAVL